MLFIPKIISCSNLQAERKFAQVFFSFALILFAIVHTVLKKMPVRVMLFSSFGRSILHKKVQKQNIYSNTNVAYQNPLDLVTVSYVIMLHRDLLPTISSTMKHKNRYILSKSEQHKRMSSPKKPAKFTANEPVFSRAK